jgi:hypothetical protein
VSQYREAISVGGSRLAPADAVGALSRLDAEGTVSVSQSLDAFEARIARLPDFAVIQSKTPDVIPYRSASELLAAPLLGLVPRAVWPNKPVLSTGYQFAIQYYGQSASTHSSAATTPEGDLYRHGGWLVLLAGGAVMGGIFRAVDSASNYSMDPRTYFLAVLMFPTVVKHELDFVGFVAALPGLVALFLIALTVSRQRLT